MKELKMQNTDYAIEGRESEIPQVVLISIEKSRSKRFTEPKKVEFKDDYIITYRGFKNSEIISTYESVLAKDYLIYSALKEAIDRRKNAEKFSETGTPMALYPASGDGLARDLQAIGIYTVEQFAEMGDAELKASGIHNHEARQIAALEFLAKKEAYEGLVKQPQETDEK